MEGTTGILPIIREGPILLFLEYLPVFILCFFRVVLPLFDFTAQREHHPSKVAAHQTFGFLNDLMRGSERSYSHRALRSGACIARQHLAQ